MYSCTNIFHRRSHCTFYMVCLYFLYGMFYWCMDKCVTLPQWVKDLRKWITWINKAISKETWQHQSKQNPMLIVLIILFLLMTWHHKVHMVLIVCNTTLYSSHSAPHTTWIVQLQKWHYWPHLGWINCSLVICVTNCCNLVWALDHMWMIINNILTTNLSISGIMYISTWFYDCCALQLVNPQYLVNCDILISIDIKYTKPP